MIRATATYTPRSSAGRFVEVNITPAVRASVEASCKLIENAAKAMCPVDTGALRESIKTQIDDQGKTIVGSVSAHVHYAAFVEFGTGIAGAGSSGAGVGPYNMAWPGMPAQPFLRPALDENRQTVLSVFRGEISSAIR